MMMMTVMIITLRIPMYYSYCTSPWYILSLSPSSSNHRLHSPLDFSLCAYPRFFSFFPYLLSIFFLLPPPSLPPSPPDILILYSSADHLPFSADVYRPYQVSVSVSTMYTFLALFRGECDRWLAARSSTIAIHGQCGAGTHQCVNESMRRFRYAGYGPLRRGSLNGSRNPIPSQKRHCTVRVQTDRVIAPYPRGPRCACFSRQSHDLSHGSPIILYCDGVLGAPLPALITAATSNPPHPSTNPHLICSRASRCTLCQMSSGYSDSDRLQRERSRSPRRRSSRSPRRSRRSYSPRSRSRSRDDYRRSDRRSRSPLSASGAAGPSGSPYGGRSGYALGRTFEDRTVAKENMMQSVRESSQQDRRVYVGNLSYDVKWHHLKDFMRQGERSWVESPRLVEGGHG